VPEAETLTIPPAARATQGDPDQSGDADALDALEAIVHPIHPISRRHLDALRDELGLVQHAIRSKPDPTRGYATDDAARALKVDLLHARTLGWDGVAKSALANLTFLEQALDDVRGSFLSVRQADGDWVAGPGSQTTLGRVMRALGETIELAPDAALVERAVVLFARALKAAGRTTEVRAQASVVLGCVAATRGPTLTASTETRDRTLLIETREVLRRLATGLHARVLDGARPRWPWPESTLTQEGALIPRALIVAGHRLGAEVMLTIGIQVLNWLIDIQTVPAGHLSPIGTGGWPMGQDRPSFDQLPLDATSLLLAAEAAYDATGDPRYGLAMERSYAWFLGANDLGVVMADPARGACADALHATGADKNRGAEATLMWLMAAEHMRALRVAMPRRVVEQPKGRTPRPGPAPSAPSMALGFAPATR
jgi:hypothetical protein